jgi:hypothetical protein
MEWLIVGLFVSNILILGVLIYGFKAFKYSVNILDHNMYHFLFRAMRAQNKVLMDSDSLSRWEAEIGRIGQEQTDIWAAEYMNFGFPHFFRGLDDRENANPTSRRGFLRSRRKRWPQHWLGV